MGKRIMNVELGLLPWRVLNLGYVGENEHTQIVIDCTEVLLDYPQATCSMVVKPPRGDQYPVTPVQDGNTFVWEITASDVVYAGSGQLQLTFYNGEEIIRSDIGSTKVSPSLETTGEAPEPLQNWMDDANAVLAEIEDMTVAASGLPAGSTPTATISDVSGHKHIAFAIPQGAKGDPGDATIDDTAGVGDRTKVWSADKSATEQQSVLSAISIKPDIMNSTETGADLDVSDTSGNVILRLKNGHMKTKKFDSENLDVMLRDATDSSADLDISDAAGNVVLRLNDGHIQTSKFDSEDVLQEITDIQGNMVEKQNIANVLSENITIRNKDILDGIYAACGKSVQNHADYTIPQFCLLISGDIHGDTDRLNSIVKFLNDVNAFDAGIMLGDIVEANWTNTIQFYTDAISKSEKPFLTVIGNHDAGTGAKTDKSYRYIADLHNKFIVPNIQYAQLESGEYQTGNTYYYKDFTDYGIRLIVLNQYDYPADVGTDGETLIYQHGYNCYSQDQITWFCNTLNNTPSNYGVIIATHSYPAKVVLDFDHNFTCLHSTQTEPNDLMDYTNDGYIIPQIVDAWIRGTSITKTFGYIPTGTWSTCIVNADFSQRGNGEFITYIGGHWHMSRLSSVYDYPDQNVYNVDCSTIYGVQGDTPRQNGLRSEDCFCALAVDRKHKRVKLFRIGAHFTQDGIDRLYTAYDY